jgi:predicted amidophosphoribosyltransferase
MNMMCRACGLFVERDVTACPRCGAPMRDDEDALGKGPDSGTVSADDREASR